MAIDGRIMQYYSVALNKRLFSTPVHAGWGSQITIFVRSVLLECINLPSILCFYLGYLDRYDQRYCYFHKSQFCVVSIETCHFPQSQNMRLSK